jgi:hypothetical protein
VFTYKLKVYGEMDEDLGEVMGEFQADWNAVAKNPWSCKDAELFNSLGGDWRQDGPPGEDWHLFFWEQADGTERLVFTLRRTKGPADPSYLSTGAEGLGWLQKAGGTFPVREDVAPGSFSFRWKVVG